VSNVLISLLLVKITFKVFILLEEDKNKTGGEIVFFSNILNYLTQRLLKYGTLTLSDLASKILILDINLV